MTLDFSDPNVELVSLLEIEIGHRIDEDAWTLALLPSAYFYLADEDNDRIKKHKCSDLSFISKVGTLGAGNDNFDNPQDVCQDETHLYITDYSNHRVVKRLISDLSYVAEIGGQGAGDGQFDGPTGICTDGTHLYICDSQNHRIKKHLCLDLSFVAEFGTGPGAGNNQFDIPYGIITDGTHLYICDQQNDRIKKHKCEDLTYVAKKGVLGAEDDNFNSPTGICTDNIHLYITDFGNSRVKKHLCSDLSYVAKESGIAPNALASPGGITTDDTHIYIAELGEGAIQKRLCTDLSFVAKAGSWGIGDDQIKDVWGMGIGEPLITTIYYITHAEGKPTKVEECLRSTMAVIEYTERASFTLCNDNPESWYWDSANSRLYVHTSGSDDPGTADKYFVQSFFWEYYTDRGGEANFNNQQYRPIIPEDAIPDITMETLEYDEGGTRRTFGNISLLNADGYFDARLNDYIYEAKKILYKVGKKGDDYADFITFWTGWTNGVSWSDTHIGIGIEDFRMLVE